MQAAPRKTDELVVFGVKVEFFNDDTFRIYTGSKEVGNKVMNYLVAEGIFAVKEPEKATREGDEWKNG